MSIDVINKAAGSQLLNLSDEVTVVIRDHEGNVLSCNHAGATSQMEEISVRVNFNGDIDEALREVQTCDKCDQGRIKIPSADYGEYDWTEWSPLI